MFHIPHPQIVGALLITGGLYLRYLMGRRYFNRLNFTGFEVYKSYSSKLITRLWEGLVKFGGLLMILLGIFSVLESLLKR